MKKLISALAGLFAAGVWGQILGDRISDVGVGGVLTGVVTYFLIWWLLLNAGCLICENRPFPR
ncbi:MAG: hypothetical protein GEV05_27615 [Betaproteobacteria bacterium]|nr:hypothetical protein [Betaproteobacteria bacterium]